MHLEAWTRLLQGSIVTVSANGDVLDSSGAARGRERAVGDPRAAGDSLAAALAAAAAGEQQRFDVRADDAASPAVFQIVVHPLSAAGEARFMLLATDVTADRGAEQALAQSERRYRRFAHACPLGIWEVDLEGRTVFMNPRMQEMLGLEDPMALGRTQESFFFDDVAQQMASLNADLIRDKHVSLDLRLKRADGSRLWTEAHFSPVRSSNGRLVGRLGSFADIQNRVRTEASLRSMLVEKELLLREVDHRVKNNLQVVSSLLGLHARRVVGDAKAKLEDARRRVRAMGIIHERLYRADDLSLIDFGDYARRLAGDVVASFSGEQTAIGLEVRAEPIHVDVELAIPCGLVLNELLSNAMEHAFAGIERGSLLVRVTKEGKGLRFEVSDDGVGMQRDPPSDSIGLELIEGLVSQMLGTLMIGARPSGRGTTASVYVPIRGKTGRFRAAETR
jgi:PAS domain S-box-containing protein